MRSNVGIGFWIFIVILVILHFVLRVGLGYNQLAPDLLVVALLLSSRQLTAGWAAGVGLLFGILDGALVPSALGASALALTILGFLGSRSRDFFSEDNYFLYALYLFAGKWLFDVMLVVITGSIFREGGSYLLVVSPLTALYAAAAGLISLAVYKAFS